jgi:hypothetical protein
MENGLKTTCMDKAQSTLLMVKFSTKASGKGVKDQERELCFGKAMGPRCMRELGLKAVDTDMAHLTMKAARNTKVIGRTITGKDLEANLTMMER